MVRAHKFLLFFLVLFLTLPLAFADLSLDLEKNYATGVDVDVIGTCDDASFVSFQLIASGSTIWVGQTDVTSDSFSRNLELDDNIGDNTYTIHAACGASNTNHEFCVGDHCNLAVGAEGNDNNNDGSGDTGSNGGSSNSGSGVTQPSSTSTPSGTCVESWVCGAWDTCFGGTQKRTCFEEHECGTFKLKPSESKVCDTVETGVAPARISNAIPPPARTTPTVEEPSSFTDNFGLLIGIPVALLILIALIIFFVWRSHHKVKAENFDELEKYVAEEMRAGYTEEQIEQNLAQAGWQKHEVDEVFERLSKQSQDPAQTAPAQTPQ